MRTLIQIVSAALIFAGLLYLLGAAGASDLDMIGNAEIVKRCLAGLAVLSAGTVIAVVGGCFYDV